MEINDNSKQYSLRWDKHAFNLASEAGVFFEDESFLDCTLSAEGQCIDAHKIILSASSSYLSNLLKIMPDKHPILIFNDIKFEELKALVAFIYNGSVNVSESNIHAFLNAAQSLLIKGLSEESKNEGKITENNKKMPKPLDIQDMKLNHRKQNSKASVFEKPDVYLESGKNFKKHRQVLPKADRGSLVECEESLSKLQEISFTKYIHQNLNSKTFMTDNKLNGPGDEKLRVSENYIVKSWKHNSVEDLNGKHKQSRNNTIKKVTLEKHVIRNEVDQGEKKLVLCEQETLIGNHSDQTKPDDLENRIKKEISSEEIMLVEPKQEILEEEDTNSEEFGSGPNGNSETIIPESDAAYDGRSVPGYYPPVVDREVPVPLLMCRTSLSEPECVEPNWMSPIAGNPPLDLPPSANAVDGHGQDLQCRTCAQDLPCPTCTKKYKSRYALNRHILYECGKARKSFSCDECGRKVTRQDTLQKHKLIHLVQHLKKKESEEGETRSKRKKSMLSVTP